MMLGGGLMLGAGLLMMLLVIGIPILLLVALLGGTAVFLKNQNRPTDVVQRPVYTAPRPIVQPSQAVLTPNRSCAHCGAGLQSDWIHCPQCGAPIN